MAIRVAVLSQRQVVRGLTFGMKQTQSPPEKTGFFRRKIHLVIPYFPSYDQVPVTEGSLKSCVRLCDKVQGLDD